MIYTYKDLAVLVEELGFLPFFKNSIPGFSVEENTPAELWFSDVQGPWEWKGPVIRDTGCAYGKFFMGKTGFISREWYTCFSNFRRDGYDFDARYDDGMASIKDKRLYDVLAAHEPIISKDWRRECGVKKRGEFDSAVSGLQMQGYVIISDFVYPTSKSGNSYGWGLAQYSTPEVFFGDYFTDNVYKNSPEKDREKIAQYLKKRFPAAENTAISKLIGIRAAFSQK